MNRNRWITPGLIAASALFCAAPFPYQWITGSNPDWQAWWSFGTFLIALIAALIAYQEYNAHIRASQPQLIAHFAKLPHESNSSVFVTNVGGGIATDIQFELQPGMKPRHNAGTEKLIHTIPVLKPHEDALVLNAGSFVALQLLAEPDQPMQSFHLEWKDASGRLYKSNGPKQNLNLGINNKQAAATGEKS